MTASSPTSNPRSLELAFVTLGSPIAHLYQVYFPGDYPDWEHASWAGLRSRVDRWLNIYRRDDYVGRAIHGHGVEVWGDRLENSSVEARGHTNYWVDGKVLEHLVRELEVGARE